MMATSSNITPQPRRSPRYALRLLQVALAVLVVWYAVHVLRGQWAAVRERFVQLHPHWGWVALSGAIFLVTYAVLIETWRRMLVAWRSSLGFWTGARIWSISNLGRYVPGKIWQIGAMGVMAQRSGVSPIAATGSAVLNTIVNLAAGFVIAALLGWQLLGAQSRGTRIAAVLFVAAAAGALATLPRLLPWAIGRVSRLSGRDLGLGPLPLSVIGIATIGNLIAWVLYGLAFTAFARGILGEMHGTVAAFIAVYALSYLVGYLVLLMPAGLGVREASMVTLLTAARLADPGQATILALTSRLWLSVLEIVPGVLFLGFDALRRARDTERP